MPEADCVIGRKYKGLTETEIIMSACRLCPRSCGADRLHGETGVCGVPADIYAGRAMLHHWEEPCISGTAEDGTDGGAGAVFFSGCVLKCVYCQNYELSHIRSSSRTRTRQNTIMPVHDRHSTDSTAGPSDTISHSYHTREITGEGICEDQVSENHLHHGQIGYQIPGKRISVERLAEIFLELQEEGANNIDLVTPTQYIPQIADALRLAGHNLPDDIDVSEKLGNDREISGELRNSDGTNKELTGDGKSSRRPGNHIRNRKLTIPVICNCGGYESVEALRLLDGLVDVYLTDFKYMDHEAARKYSAAADYPERAEEALAEMVRQCPEAVFADNGLIQKGVIVRHLVLPGMVHNSKDTIRYIYRTYGNHVWFSLMNQYTPYAEAAKRFPELNRRVTKREYNAVIDYALSLGVENAYMQEGATQKESFIPSFDGEGI